LRGALLLGLAGLLLACGSRSKPTGEPAIPTPQVEYDGCWAVYTRGPVCALKAERQLTLWVKDRPDLKVEIRAGDHIVNARGLSIAEGRRFALTFRRKASRLTVRLCRPDGPCGPAWTLTLAPSGDLQWLDKVRELQKTGEYPQARARLGQLLTSVPGKERGLIFYMLAFLDQNDKERMVDDLSLGVAADEAVGNLKGKVDKVAWLVRLDILQDHFGEARKRLDDLELTPGAPAIAKYLVSYNQGLLAERTGDYRKALESLRQAAALAERADLRPELMWKAEQLLAGVLQEIGRSREASELFVRLRAHPHPGPDQPCDLGDLLNNEGWSRLLAREAGESAEDPIPLLEEAQSEFEAKKNHCNDEKRLNARLNLAFADQQAGRSSEAGHTLEGAHALASKAPPHLRLWWLDLEARVAIKKEPRRALDLYDELAREAERSLSLEGRFRAEVGRARARLALGPGQRQAAIADLARADELIDEQSWHVPAYEGRDHLVGQREAVTQQHLELLLAEGRRQEALDLVRRDRSRLLRQLAFRDRLTQLKPGEQRKWDQALSQIRALRKSIDAEAATRWDVPRDQVARAKQRYASQLELAQHELDHALAGLGNLGSRAVSLSPPGDGEVILAYHRLSKGWVGLAAHGRDVEVSRFPMDAEPPADPRRLAKLLLAPFQKIIESAGRIRVLSYGSLRGVDFDGLPFQGEPLSARHLVVYSLDLPGRPPRPAAAPTGKAALLVSNPETDQGYLPAAAEEAKAVQRAIQSWRPVWALSWLQDERAGSKAVSDALPDVDLFHFAGHGSFAGLGGWDSALPLADGSRLTLGDILTLRRVPRWVVLSACDAGHSSDQASSEGIGLANAFLLAGSQEVIASTRKVDDAMARFLVSELYRGWKPGEDLARQLQRAEAVCRQQYGQADCTSFRLIEP
jgi:tetratricopeptide (TPR) repeat protein